MYGNEARRTAVFWISCSFETGNVSAALEKHTLRATTTLWYEKIAVPAARPFESAFGPQNPMVEQNKTKQKNGVLKIILIPTPLHSSMRVLPPAK